ncbi:PorT family protein [bacterium]|nr:PorT family protein [bacterium]
MKVKNVAILILGLLLSELSFAQAEFRFGLKASANLGWIQPSSKNIDRNGTNLGVSYGIMGDYYFRPNYAISTELLISQINGSMIINSPQTFTNDTANTVIEGLNYTFRNQFVEIPISLKFRTKEIGYITYWANFGIAPSFLINARASINSDVPAIIQANDPTNYRTNDNEGDPFTVNDFDDQVFLIRMPLVIGGGIEYKIAGSTSLMAGVRFSNSFTDMFVKDKDIDAKQNFFSLNVGVLF